MAHTRKTERRLLTANEMEFVEKARHPTLAGMVHADLVALVHNLRERRDRAQAIANDQRRSLRGKGGRGEVTYDKADSGNRQKAAVLTDALTRVRRELKRRADFLAHLELVANARRALELKRAADVPHHPEAGDHANTGMRPKQKRRLERIGSRSGEAGRVTKFVAVAQAKKDSR